MDDEILAGLERFDDDDCELHMDGRTVDNPDDTEFFVEDITEKELRF